MNNTTSLFESLGEILKPNPPKKIRLFETTTDDMLSVGMSVAYMGHDGEFTGHRTGVILDRFEQDGVILYNVEGFAYMASELKLLY